MWLFVIFAAEIVMYLMTGCCLKPCCGSYNICAILLFLKSEEFCILKCNYLGVLYKDYGPINACWMLYNWI